MKRPINSSIVTTHVDKEGYRYRLSSTPDHAYATFDYTIVASLYLVYDVDAWRVHNAWVDDGFRRRGIATALYDYAFRRGFRPLKASRIQTEAGAALWRKHIKDVLTHKGHVITRDHPYYNYWCPLKFL